MKYIKIIFQHIFMMRVKIHIFFRNQLWIFICCIHLLLLLKLLPCLKILFLLLILASWVLNILLHDLNQRVYKYKKKIWGKVWFYHDISPWILMKYIQLHLFSFFYLSITFFIKKKSINQQKKLQWITAKFKTYRTISINVLQFIQEKTVKVHI